MASNVPPTAVPTDVTAVPTAAVPTAAVPATAVPTAAVPTAVPAVPAQFADILEKIKQGLSRKPLATGRNDPFVSGLPDQ